MSEQRHALVIATQCRNMRALNRLAPAAEDLRDVLLHPHYGACSPALPDGSALIMGALGQGEIENAVRAAVEHAAQRQATLILALLGHGFTPGTQATLYLMAAESREDDANSAVNVPALLEAAINRANVRGVVTLVDTCHAAGAMPAAPALASGAAQGRTRLDLLMAAAVGQPAVDFRMTHALVRLIRDGAGDAANLDLASIVDELRRQARPQAVAFQRYHGTAGNLWLSHNARVAVSTDKLGAYGYSRYRSLMRSAFPDLAELPPLSEAIRMLEKLPASPPGSGDLTAVIRTVDLLRKPPLRDIVTTEALHRAARTTLPLELFTSGAAAEAEVVAYLGLNPPVGRNGRAELLRFVMTLAADAGCDLNDAALCGWVDDLGLITLANDLRRELADRQAGEQLRLIISLHAGLTDDDWPETVLAWLTLDDRDIDHTPYPCSPTPSGVQAAIFAAVDHAQWIADQNGLPLRRVEIAAPAGLLLRWRPEELAYRSRLGWDYYVILHWSERLKQSSEVRRGNHSMRERLRTERNPGVPFHWLPEAEIRDIERLTERLRDRQLGTAVALESRPADALELLLSYTPIVIWPTEDLPADPAADLTAAWPNLPIGFTEAYRNRWRDPSFPDAVARLRAVWDDESWLKFCARGHWRPDGKDPA